MIVRPGVAFTEAADGDMNNPLDRAAVAARLGVSPEWALLTQVHGADVHVVDSPTRLDGDGVVTSVRGLPCAVRTADCVGVVIRGPGAVGVAHAGWRGARDGVVERVAEVMVGAGAPPTTALLGPFIGPCCFEVGTEVASAFPGAVTETTWGTTSVDLERVVRAALPGVEVEVVGGCTRCGDGWHSHRRDRTEHRLGAIGWVP